MPLVPIDLEIARVKQEIEQKRLQLRQVKSEMANIRAHYSQSVHMHGGGTVGKLVRAAQHGAKNGRLKSHQGNKERLEREKLALDQQLNQLKVLKAQGTTHVKGK